MNYTKKFVKFQCHFVQAEPLGDEATKAINHCRSHLYDLYLVGVDERGEGFGNISMRHKDKGFIITGSQTGQYRILLPKHIVLVKKCNFFDNEVYACGEIMPSSESPSHGALYEGDERIGAVIHVHSLLLWHKLMDSRYISTPAEAQYGTSELALSILDLFKRTHIFQQKVFAMGGHEAGVMAFGSNLEEAEMNLMEYYRGLADRRS